MAKETFDRSKPHLNIGTVHTSTFEDTSGALIVADLGSDTDGNPAPSSILALSAPASSSVETATVVFPVDDYFVFDPAVSGESVSIDYQLDLDPTTFAGFSEIDVTFAILQGGNEFVASRSAGSIDGSEVGWTTISQTGLRAEDFEAVDGSSSLPQMGQLYQFGYAFSGEYSTTALSLKLGLDNMQVEITTVPEPSSILLAAAMGATLLWSRWFSNDDNERG